MLARAKQAVAGRLRRVCAHLDDQEFQTLITRIAEIEIKYAMRRDEMPPPGERRPRPNAGDGDGTGR
jgi:hypothetical protein